MRSRSLPRWLWLCALVMLSVRGWAAESDADATHSEVASIRLTVSAKGGRISSFCIDLDGNLLACEPAAKAIRVVSPDGKAAATWTLDLSPEAACVHSDGTVFVGGKGDLARLDKSGKVMASAKCPVSGPNEGGVSAIATSGNDLFVALRVGFGFSVYRFGLDLGQPVEIVKGLRGCCGQMHIVAKDGVVYAAENARKRVVSFDRDGKELGKWGKDSREDLDGFGSCCNPMNLCFGPGGELYTSESQGRVKRYTPDGKLLGLVGLPQVGGGCLNVTVAVSRDASRVYVLDSQANAIRVLAKK